MEAGLSMEGGIDNDATTEVFGLRCLDVSLDTAAHCVIDRAVSNTPTRVVFVNAHAINNCFSNTEMLNACAKADIVFADGVGMALAAKIQGTRLEHNLNGTDLFPVLCRHASDADIPIALLGAKPGVTDLCVDRLSSSYPGLSIAWHHHGYFGNGECKGLIEQINASGARILLVGLGVPAQELWISKNRSLLQVPVVMGVGGLFDFESGLVPRAPVAIRQLRLEWLFRLSLEPGRLYRRYLLGGGPFIRHAIHYRNSHVANS